MRLFDEDEEWEEEKDEDEDPSQAASEPASLEEESMSHDECEDEYSLRTNQAREHADRYHQPLILQIEVERKKDCHREERGLETAYAPIGERAVRDRPEGLCPWELSLLITYLAVFLKMT